MEGISSNDGSLSYVGGANGLMLKPAFCEICVWGRNLLLANELQQINL